MGRSPGRPRGANPPPEARSQRLLGRLASLWGTPTLASIAVTTNPRLRRTLGRLLARPWRIELSARAAATDNGFVQVLTHEAAHAAVVLGGRAGSVPPHGSEWRRLMAVAGFPHATATEWRCRTAPQDTGRRPGGGQKASAPAGRYLHWCPVCQFSRIARRPVGAWRCSACVEAGLPGRLAISRTTRSTGSPQ